MSVFDGYISWSELNTFRQCPHKWYLSYVERLSFPRTGGATVLGTEWHALLERWFADEAQARKSVRVDLDARIDACRSDSEMEQLHTLTWMWDGWLEFGHRPFIGWKVDTIEASEYVPLDAHTRIKVKKDLAIYDPMGRLWVVDHKSTSRHTKPDEVDLAFDDQAGLYLLGEHLKGKKPYGAVWNYAVTKNSKAGRAADERFWQVYHARTVKELEMVRREALADVARMRAMVTLQEATRHPDKEHCRWLCEFRSACLLARRGELKDEVQAILDMGASKYVPSVKPSE